MDKNIQIAPSACVALSSEFEGYNRIGAHSFYSGHLGYASYIGDHCHINADIGKFVCIGPRVITARGNHPTSDWASIHPAFFSTAKQCGLTFTDKNLFQEKKERIIIGNDVWIGDSTILMDGIKIGNGAVIAAGAVVAKDVEPYAIVGGVPTKVIRFRFQNKEVIDKLENTQWWNKPNHWMREHAKLFQNADALLNYFDEQVMKEKR